MPFSLPLKTLPLAALGAISALSLQAQIIPQQISTTQSSTAPYNSTGVILTEVNSNSYRGSGVVARDKRLIYTCAHVLFDEGAWATTTQFSRAWNDSEQPANDKRVTLRGYRYYQTYAAAANDDPNSEESFSLDFAIGYRNANTNFGPVVSAQVDGTPLLQSASTSKMVLGYPSYRDYDSLLGFYYLHRTGPFSSAMRVELDSYHTLIGASTGPGNSGGPVLAKVGDSYTLVGILVSGYRFGMGVHGLNAAADNMATNVLRAVGGIIGPNTTGTYSNSTAQLLPDASSKYIARSFIVSDMTANISAVRMNMNITTTYRGDLDVYVRSSTGRIRWINKHSLDNSATNLTLSNVNYTSTFAGTNPNGTWEVFMRDFYRGDRATFQNFSVALTSN